MIYALEITKKAEKALDKIDLIYSKKIRDRIRSLKDDPRHSGCLKMEGYQNTYRTRIGKYRIIYEIYDKKVLIIIVNIDHRKDVYR